MFVFKKRPENNNEKPKTNPVAISTRATGVISIDPGKEHCAVVRYDCVQDRFTHAALLNLLCCCDQQGDDDDVAIVQPPPPSKSGQKRGKTRRKPRAKKHHVPTAFEYPPQLIRYFDGIPELFAGGSERGGRVVVAVERQNARDTGNMVTQAVFQTRYGASSVLQNPTAVKKFWNTATLAVSKSQPPAFRMTGSHSVNKTDATRFAERFLSKSEMELFHRAAYDNAKHKLTCAVSQQKNKSRKRGGTQKRKRQPTVGTPAIIRPKTDDLVDAALQALYAYHIDCKIDASDSQGPAVKRIKRNITQRTLHDGPWLQHTQPSAANRVQNRKKRQRRAKKDGV